ncbi:O-methyltransferase [Canibacter zhoujuaniae]|uniref:O-methyltransferase n=1 Tax=Canibacter zhoujuaniae TaxID=2708343 RepID=UPI0014209D90|nr:class I SAM-dependent methyltransferase [Canibacter zhoujuaniae]
MSKIESNWQYTEQFPVETEHLAKARRLSLELGVTPVSRSIAAALSNTVLISRAKQICELGSGLGVSGLALLRYAPQAHLTSIDIEPEYQRQSRPLFEEAGVSGSRLRMIQGDAMEVLPRLNTGSYDLLVIDADPKNLLAYVEFGLQVIRPGGSIIVPNAFNEGHVSDPAARDEVTQNFRDLLEMMADSPAVSSQLSPIGNGLLTLTRLP